MKTPLNKLSVEWRKRPKELYPYRYEKAFIEGLEHCADELDAALPKWTKITADPNTQPSPLSHNTILYRKPVFLGAVRAGWGPLTEARCSGTTSLPIGYEWRPLCSIDHPPEDNT